ncbi:MAG: UV damage endonuclease UvsE, partial [Chloroflexota bacterium]
TWTEHADYINPFEFAAFCALGEALRPFDVMLEAKARDLALLKLRRDLARYAPEVAAAVR